jgi:hypothetical protein
MHRALAGGKDGYPGPTALWPGSPAGTYTASS